MLHWQFASRQSRPAGWYIIALVVVLFFVIYGIVEQIYAMSVATFLFAGVYILKENNSAPLTDVQITEAGIQVESSFYDYGQFTSFAILYDGQIASILRLGMKKGITSLLDIPLSSQVDISELKSTLLEYLSENPDAEFTKSDRVIQAMKL